MTGITQDTDTEQGRAATWCGGMAFTFDLVARLVAEGALAAEAVPLIWQEIAEGCPPGPFISGTWNPPEPQDRAPG